MTDTIIDTYKGFDISVSSSGNFSSDGIDGRFDTCEKIKATIDIQSKVKYKKIDGLLVSIHANGFDEVFITRPSSGNRNFWYQSKHGKNRGTSRSACLDTEQNRIAINTMIELSKKISMLSKQREDIYKQLTSQPITLEQI